MPEELGVLIKQTQAVLHQRMDEALRPLGLSVPQYVCLQALRDLPGITGSELARRAFVSRQSMNVLLQGLQARGLVKRSAEPGPRRERTTTLTPASAELVDRARVAVAGVAEEMAAPFDSNGLTAFRAGLVAARDALAAGDVARRLG